MVNYHSSRGMIRGSTDIRRKRLLDAVVNSMGVDIGSGARMSDATVLDPQIPPDKSEDGRDQPEELKNSTPDLARHAILLGGIVERYDKTAEGSLIRVLEPAWRLIIRAIAKDPAAIHLLRPEQMEELIAASYEKAGFDEVVLTPRSGDYGRDVIAVKHGWGSLRILDQVKAYSPGHRVPADDVRALLHVLTNDRNATKAILTTTSSFAPRIHVDPGIAPYLPHRLELIDGAQLNRRLLELNSDDSSEQF